MEYIIIDNATLKARAKRQVEQILADYKAEGVTEITAICVMNGAKVYFDDLMEAGLSSSPDLKVNSVF